jgi:hypothetical protein
LLNLPYIIFEALDEPAQNYLNTFLDSPHITALFIRTKRNRRNAISMTGLLATWIMEACYIVFAGILANLVPILPKVTNIG